MTAATRLSREERKARTRDDLVQAALRVFLRHGFHSASLDEIAEEAGYTKGAVYSNFRGKDDLLLAVLDDHYRRRAGAYAELLVEEPTPEAAYRAVARFMLAADAAEPGWTPLLTEVMVHASRHDDLRAAVVEIRERFLDSMAGIIEQLASRHGVEYRLPAKDVARGSSAMARGIFVDLLLDPDSVSPAQLEEMHTAYMQGLTVTDAEARDR